MKRVVAKSWKTFIASRGSRIAAIFQIPFTPEIYFYCYLCDDFVFVSFFFILLDYAVLIKCSFLFGKASETKVLDQPIAFLDIFQLFNLVSVFWSQCIRWVLHLEVTVVTGNCCQFVFLHNFLATWQIIVSANYAMIDCEERFESYFFYFCIKCCSCDAFILSLISSLFN